MQVNIVKRVDISMTEADLREMIVAKIKEHDSEIVVRDIKFTQRRNPTMIEVSVDAQFGGVASEPLQEPVEEVVSEEEQSDLPLEEDAPEAVTEATEDETSEEEQPAVLFG